jgi:hypothetical protein
LLIKHLQRLPISKPAHPRHNYGTPNLNRTQRRVSQPDSRTGLSFKRVPESGKDDHLIEVFSMLLTAAGGTDMQTVSGCLPLSNSRFAQTGYDVRLILLHPSGTTCDVRGPIVGYGKSGNQFQ